MSGFDTYWDRMYHNPDGTMREEKRLELLAKGWTEDKILATEKDFLARKADREFYERSRTPGTTVKDRVIERTGLTTEEALSEGYLSLDDIADNSTDEKPEEIHGRYEPSLPDEKF